MSTNKWGREANDNKDAGVIAPLVVAILLTVAIIGVGICAGYFATDFIRGLVQ